MNIKQILTILLIIFVVGSLAYMIGSEQKTKSSQIPDSPASIPQARPVASGEPAVAQQNEPVFSTNAAANDPHGTQVIVYYFHGDMRCPTCHKLETYAKEALDTYFADELASKALVWKVVNVDKPENRHFIQDYKLVTKSIVLSETTDGKESRWKNLDLIWQKVGDKESYLQYIQASIFKFL